MLSPYETMVSERSGLFSFLLSLSYYPGCLDSALGLVIAGFPATGCRDGFRKATPNSAFAWPSLRTPGLGCRAPRGTVQWVPERLLPPRISALGTLRGVPGPPARARGERGAPAVRRSLGQDGRALPRYPGAPPSQAPGSLRPRFEQPPCRPPPATRSSQSRRAWAGGGVRERPKGPGVPRRWPCRSRGAAPR